MSVQHALIEKAHHFAALAHATAGQTCKYTGSPYIQHPAAVVRTLEQCTAKVELLCAGWLHDVVEDTAVSLAQVEAEFGARVAGLVAMVTNPPKQPGEGRATHQARVIAHLAGADADGKTLKLADVLCNTSTIVERDPRFARTYIPEKLALMETLRDGHAELWHAVWHQLHACEAQLAGSPAEIGRDTRGPQP